MSSSEAQNKIRTVDRNVRWKELKTTKLKHPTKSEHFQLTEDPLEKKPYKLIQEEDYTIFIPVTFKPK